MQNPKPPQIRAFIKLRKPGNPIRPIINFQNAPIYKLAKFYNILNNRCKMPNTFNIHNSISLIDDLKNMKISENTRLCSFDIKNIYSNIPTRELNNIIINIAKRNYIQVDVINEI
jgi:hypothetical protein